MPMHRQTTVEAGQPIIVEAVEPLQPITAEEAVEDRTDNSGRGGNTATNAPTTSTDNGQNKQPAASDPIGDALLHGGAKLLCYGLTQSSICSGLAAHVVSGHHHHHN